jgi:hypothetical protein
MDVTSNLTHSGLHLEVLLYSKKLAFCRGLEFMAGSQCLE